MGFRFSRNCGYGPNQMGKKVEHDMEAEVFPKLGVPFRPTYNRTMYLGAYGGFPIWESPRLFIRCIYEILHDPKYPKPWE